MAQIDREHIRDILDRTRTLIGECHPRLPGSPGCRRAAERLRDAWAKSCEQAFLEEFTQHPASFFTMNRVLAAVYLLAGPFFFLGGAGPLVSAALFSLGTFFFIDEFAFLGRFFDPLFPKKPGANAVGIMEPATDVRQQIVLVAHHDSTPVCNFLEKRPWAYAFRVVSPIVFHLAANIGAILVAAGVRTGPAGDDFLRPAVKLIILAGCVFIVPLFRYYGRTASPGASDNLVSGLLLVKLSELLKSGGEPRPKHTRLVFLSTDGEENGQRGSFAYARRHRAEMLRTKTYVFNLDTLSRSEDLACLKTDLNGFVRLSPALAGECLKIAAGLGRPLKAIRFPFGGGGTDAGQFARVGIESTSIIGISTRLNRGGVDYHSSRDTVEAIDPAAVETGLAVAVRFIHDKDGEAGCLS
ncbi:MAG: M28 family peptidase [Acidobacteriota bacterium]|nr:M28 family peptidase [Acidobacteriota bacterium]